jgi:hypothetical protein
MLRTDALPSAGLQALLGVVRHEAAARRAPPVARPRGGKGAGRGA